LETQSFLPIIYPAMTFRHRDGITWHSLAYLCFMHIISLPAVAAAVLGKEGLPWEQQQHQEEVAHRRELPA
jgi:hypothetical protein